MGLFRRKDPVKDKLKELTGGIFLNETFIALLRSQGLEIDDGIDIQRQLKSEIKQGAVTVDNIEERLEFLISKRTVEGFKENPVLCSACNTPNDPSSNFCIKCGHDLKGLKPHKTESILKVKNLKRKTAFLSNYDHNVKTCNRCGEVLLKNHSFCYNCGFDFASIKDRKLSRLEEMYESAIEKKYSPEFKVAYVLYLNDFEKRPSKSFLMEFNTTEDSLKSQAISDEFVEYGSPLASARKSTVKDLKEILKSHALKVSGKKDELIERLGENLTDKELEKYFPEKSYQISQKGSDFVSRNSHIIYIYENDRISDVIMPKEIDEIFGENKHSLVETQDLLLDYFSGNDYYLNAIIAIYEDREDTDKLLEYRLKKFLFDLNAIPAGFHPTDIAKLTETIRRLSLSVDELKRLFEDAYENSKFEKHIEKQDCFIFLLRVFNGEDADEIAYEINENRH